VTYSVSVYTVFPSFHYTRLIIAVVSLIYSGWTFSSPAMHHLHTTPCCLDTSPAGLSHDIPQYLGL